MNYIVRKITAHVKDDWEVPHSKFQFNKILKNFWVQEMLIAKNGLSHIFQVVLKMILVRMIHGEKSAKKKFLSKKNWSRIFWVQKKGWFKKIISFLEIRRKITVSFYTSNNYQYHWLTKQKKLAGAWDISTNSISLGVTDT